MTASQGRGSLRAVIRLGFLGFGLSVLGLWPGLAMAQTAKGAGVVTALAGEVTVARVAAPQPQPLKFKDDVFLRDRIATGENSLVRVLLGGKAVVTALEFSVLTITEEPNRSTIDIEKGRMGLSVARQRLAPGESLEIRTPNAVAAVRGTSLIVEVLLAAAVTSSFYMLQGSADIVPRDTPTVTPARVEVQRVLSVTGRSLQPPRPFPPGFSGQFAGILLKAKGQLAVVPPLDAAKDLGIRQQTNAVALTNALLPVGAAAPVRPGEPARGPEPAPVLAAPVLPPVFAREIRTDLGRIILPGPDVIRRGPELGFPRAFDPRGLGPGGSLGGTFGGATLGGAAVGGATLGGGELRGLYPAYKPPLRLRVLTP